MLATGSQDARIRLWKFTTVIQDNLMVDTSNAAPNLLNQAGNDDSSGSETGEDKQAAEEEEEGEARMEIFQDKRVTRVTLEALLLGHEEMVTGVSWHPNPKEIYDEDLVLISSSMDRSILLWTSALDDGIWTPLTRGTLYCMSVSGYWISS
jgi:elongator complex protein 2